MSREFFARRNDTETTWNREGPPAMPAGPRFFRPPPISKGGPFFPPPPKKPPGRWLAFPAPARRRKGGRPRPRAAGPRAPAENSPGKKPPDVNEKPFLVSLTSPNGNAGPASPPQALFCRPARLAKRVLLLNRRDGQKVTRKGKPRAAARRRPPPCGLGGGGQNMGKTSGNPRPRKAFCPCSGPPPRSVGSQQNQLPANLSALMRAGVSRVRPVFRILRVIACFRAVLVVCRKKSFFPPPEARRLTGSAPEARPFPAIGLPMSGRQGGARRWQGRAAGFGPPGRKVARGARKLHRACNFGVCMGTGARRGGAAGIRFGREARRA